MRCEHVTTEFRKASASNYIPVAIRRRCRRKARVLAEIPYGSEVLAYNLCCEDADRRSRDVLATRGKVVVTTELPDDPNDYVPARDEHGRFCRAGS